MTGGWRSPLGSARPTAHDDVEEWDEERIRAALEERRRAEATATEPEDDGLRADGGENTHASRVAEQLALADEEDGEDEEPPALCVGDHVRDRDRSEDAPTMLVVGTPLEAASEYDVTDDDSVADLNPEYPSDDDVLQVVFPSRTDVSTRPLDRYAFPRHRLRLETPVHEPEE